MVWSNHEFGSLMLCHPPLASSARSQLSKLAAWPVSDRRQDAVTRVACSIAGDAKQSRDQTLD
jgi:hypothetical protein